MSKNHLLRELRLKHGYTQQRLAALTGINQTYVSLIEVGRRVPSFRVGRRIAQVLYADPFVLFGELEDSVPSASPNARPV